MLITIDFETYYSKDYSLSKLQTDAYILDAQFEIIGVSIKQGDAPPEWFSGSLEEVKQWCAARIDHTSTVCAHHAHFDGFILTQVLGIRPARWVDTLGMSRALYPYLKSHSLSALVKEIGLGEKGTEVINAIGKRRSDFTPQELDRYANYCMNDSALTHTLAALMLPKLPELELSIIDMTVRMFTEPQLYLDENKLDEYYHKEVNRKKELLEKISCDTKSLMSNPKFADLLLDLGVTPPMKISPRTGKMTYAFSKTDKHFQALLDHPDPQVQALVEARLGVKSNIFETRTQRLLATAKRSKYLPVYLHYWGAKTTGRHSGGNQMNMQNVPARGAGSEVREAIIAPPGYKVVVGDSSNIELRVAMAMAGQDDILGKLYAGTDLYCDFASKLFGRTITEDDKPERMLGKIAMLSLQYGAGAEKFKEMVRIQAKRHLTLDEATDIVNLYRAVHAKVVSLWWYCGNDVLRFIHNRDVLRSVDVNGWFLTTHDGFALPGFPGVVYKKLRKDVDGQWIYDAGSGSSVKIYGGKVVENLCQHAARQIVLWQTACVNSKYKVALSVHDEIVCVVPDEKVAECKAYMEAVLATAPKWCRGKIPLAGKVGVGQSYGEAK